MNRITINYSRRYQTTGAPFPGVVCRVETDSHDPEWFSVSATGENRLDARRNAFQLIRAAVYHPLENFAIIDGKKYDVEEPGY